MKPSVSFLLWLIVTIVHVALVLTLSPELPDKVIKQFDFSGHPTSSMSKDSFVYFKILMPLAVSTFIYLLMWLFPKSANIPNKNYWFEEGHYQNTCRQLKNFAWWTSTLLTAFMSLIFIGLFQANRGGTFNYHAVLPWLLVAMSLLAIGVALLLWSWFRMFRLPDSTKSQS